MQTNKKRACVPYRLVCSMADTAVTIQEALCRNIVEAHSGKWTVANLRMKGDPCGEKSFIIPTPCQIT